MYTSTCTRKVHTSVFTHVYTCAHSCVFTRVDVHCLHMCVRTCVDAFFYIRTDAFVLSLAGLDAPRAVGVCKPIKSRPPFALSMAGVEFARRRHKRKCTAAKGWFILVQRCLGCCWNVHAHFPADERGSRQQLRRKRSAPSQFGADRCGRAGLRVADADVHRWLGCCR